MIEYVYNIIDERNKSVIVLMSYVHKSMEIWWRRNKWRKNR